jgi:ribosome biogenesis GTPase
MTQATAYPDTSIMARDFSRFLKSPATPATTALSPLARLGWQPHLAQQIGADDFVRTPPVRVVAVHRSGLTVEGDGVATELPPGIEATVGDWLLYDARRPSASPVLARKSPVRRRAPGTDRQWQMIAANVDTALIVTSCNLDFNVARLERYLALAFEAGVEPVIVLTKADMADPAPYVAAATAIAAVPVVAVDALGPDAGAVLAPWNRTGRTIAFLGSSGVGKSTLVNALLGRAAVATAAIREEDAHGRHTTTARQLHLVEGGALVLDTPGMRELQLADAEAGIAEVFADLDALARTCRFSDCRHDSEPGCAIRAGVETGEVDPARLLRWQKLKREEAFNSASLAERRGRERAFGRMVRSILKDKPAKR